ncbi:tetratricopeptide repeat protein [Alkalinema sp. FACHB-956]|uniref:tetratricopeptide repeat protein n=1 Tax=Alkalinema sp. FACHB-956 TaxID=2692768 RepID=UPI0018F022BD|nr:tetratricopeptide repeat protein [Alkalinema sp. FACHB-956]
MADQERRDRENQRNFRKLILSVRAGLGRLDLLLVVCDNPSYRDELIRQYEQELQGKDITCLRVRLQPEQPSLKQALLELGTREAVLHGDLPVVVTVLGADQLLAARLGEEKSARERLFFSLQWTREALRQFQFPLILWLTEEMTRQLAQQAPDFWSWRGGVFEFVRPMVWQTEAGGQRQWGREATTYAPEALANPEELQQQITEIQAQDPESPLLESLYESLGETYYKRLQQGQAVDRQKEQELAIVAFQEAISRREALEDLTPLAVSLSYLALLYDSMGRYGEAEPLFQRALQIREAQLGPDHPDTATSLNNLALSYRSMGRYGEAEPLYQRALQIREAQLGPDHPDTATSLNNIAALYDFIGHYGEAEPLYQRALQIREAQLGPDHADTATSLNNMAVLYRSTGRYGEAEPLYQRALQIREAQLGPDHPDTATSLNNIAELYRSMGRYGEAEPLYQRALQIREAQLGPDHPDTAQSLNNLAGLYDSMGRYGEAEPLYQRALQISEAQLGPDHPSTATSLNNIAALYRSMGHYGEAEPLYQRALQIREAQLGPDHPSTATSLNNLAALYDSMGRYGEAEPLYLRTLAIFMNVLGKTHPNTQTVQNNYRYLLQQTLAAGKAEELSDHPMTQAILEELRQI